MYYLFIIIKHIQLFSLIQSQLFLYSLDDGDAVDQEEERVVKKFRMGN